MRKLTAALLILPVLGLAGCDQFLARNYGFTAKARALPEGAKLMSVSWKGESLWRLYYLPSTRQCIFEEESAVGSLEGKVVIDGCEPLAIVTASPAQPSPGTQSSHP